MEYGQDLYPKTARYYTGIKLMSRHTIDSAIKTLSRSEKNPIDIPSTLQKVIEQQNSHGRLKAFIARVISKKELSVFEPAAHVTVFKDLGDEKPAVFDGAMQFPALFNEIDDQL